MDDNKSIYKNIDVTDTARPMPAYLRLYWSLVDDIVSGRYSYGSKLPSKRVLADLKGISVITAKHALDLLSEEGYVQSRQRSGVYVTYQAEGFQTEKKPAERGPAVIEAEEKTSDTGEFPFSVLAKTMRRVLLDYGEKILVKSSNHGCAQLRNEICLYLARSRGIIVDPGQVIIGAGTEYLYGLIAQLLGTGELIAIENPSYSKIRLVYESMGIVCDPLTMTSEGIASEELERTAARVLHVTPFHSFPSGITADISKKHEYLRWAGKRRGILIEDNYDSELTISTKAEEPLFSMDPDINVIYLNTFSRTLAPSMRIGYMILPPGLTGLFHSKLGFYSCTVPIFDQFVLAELLRNGDFERHINRIRRKRRRNA